MTWILADQRTLNRTSSTEVTEMTAWLDWFYLTYLPTRGYSTYKGNSGNDLYYGSKQSWASQTGALMETTHVQEFELLSEDTIAYSWDLAETDPTVVGTTRATNNSAPLLSNSGTFDLQVWESDLDNNSFLVRRPGIAIDFESNLYAFSMPFASRNNDALSTDFWEAWFTSSLIRTGTPHICPLGVYGNDSGFVSNRVLLAGSSQYMGPWCSHFYQVSDMFMKHNQSSNANSNNGVPIYSTSSSCTAVQIEDDFYIDLNEGETVSLLLKTGSVNPDNPNP